MNTGNEADHIEATVGTNRNRISIGYRESRQISELTILSDCERHRLLDTWNKSQADFPKGNCIQQLFETQAARTPEAVAVVFEGEHLTYARLNEKANQLAHHLRKFGIGPDVLAGICVERSLEMLVGLMGILKAGGTYLPLDPTFPKERLGFMLADSQASVLLTQERLLGLLPSEGLKVVCLDTDREMVARESRENPASEVTSDNLAYVIYTSGSTGKPKGVQIPHRAVVNLLHSMEKQPGLTRQDVLLAVTTLSFDIAVLELFLPLIVGARVEVVSSEAAFDGIQLAKKLDNSGATVMQATPATWRLLLETGWSGNDGLKIFCGGEALPQDLAEQLLERGASLWNMYGPTETTVWSAVHQVEAVDGPISIGRPIANTQIYLLDDNLQPVPVGVSGALYIGGDGLARGYLNRPELTAEKFIINPFDPEGKALIYNTGDLARYLPDGRIECLGRIDHQVKIRGFRIELGEIEAVLSRHPAIQKNVVIVREDEPGDKRIVGYLVLKREPAPTVNELRNLLMEKLPDYMVPSAFVFLGTLPLTPNKKVNRRALPAPGHTRPELENGFVAPRTSTEKELSRIWAEVIGVEQVGIYDNFFELGGHSLLAARIIFRIHGIFPVVLPLRVFFETPTIAELSKVIEKANDSNTGLRMPAIVPLDREAHRIKRFSPGTSVDKKLKGQHNDTGQF